MDALLRAQVKPARLDKPLEARIARADRDHLHLLILESGCDAAFLPPGDSTLVTLFTPKGWYQVAAVIASYIEPELRLRLIEPSHPANSQQSHGYLCRLEVEISVKENSPEKETWLEAMAEEISQGGMKLLVSQTAALASVLQIRCSLVGSREPVLIVARVVARYTGTSDKQKIEVTFAGMTGTDQAWFRRMFP